MQDFAPGLERAFDLVPQEGSSPIAAVSGKVPDWLRGTLYLNGPARFHRGPSRARHWLDGDGMVAALSFGDEGFTFTSRFVRSHKLVAEEEAGRFLFRAFGTRFEGDRLLRGVALASPVNVSVLPFAGRLLAFGEQGLPWELDPTTLETRGEYTFGGRLNAVSPLSAHPKIDPATGEMWNFGISFATEQPSLTLYHFAPDGSLLYRRRHTLDLAASVHDFNLSSRYLVLHLGPYVLDVGAFLRQGASVQEALSWQQELGSRLLIFDRSTGDFVAAVEAGRGYCLHHINAFEEGDLLAIDVVELEEPVYPDYQPLPDLFVEVKGATPVRYLVDVDAATVRERRALPFTAAADFPVHDPSSTGRSYTSFWMLAISQTGRSGRKFLDQLVRGDWQRGTVEEVYRPAQGCYLAAEPTFVPKPGGDEGEGVVLVPELDLERLETTFLVVGDGVARLPLGRAIHPCFHACFHPVPGVSLRSTPA